MTTERIHPFPDSKVEILRADVMTVKDLALVLRKGDRQVREALIRGDIPCGHKIGRDWRISRVAFERWLHGTESNAQEV